MTEPAVIVPREFLDTEAENLDTVMGTFFGGTRALYCMVPEAVADLAIFSAAATPQGRYREAFALRAMLSTDAIRLLRDAGRASLAAALRESAP